MKKYRFEHGKTSDGEKYLWLYGTDPSWPYSLCSIFTAEYSSKKKAEDAIVLIYENMLKFYQWYDVVSKLTNDEKMHHPDFSHLNRTGHTIFFKTDLHMDCKTYPVGKLTNADVYKYSTGDYAHHAEIDRLKFTTAYAGKEIVGAKKQEIINKVKSGEYVFYNFYIIDPKEPNKMICHHEAD